MKTVEPTFVVKYEKLLETHLAYKTAGKREQELLTGGTMWDSLKGRKPAWKHYSVGRVLP